MDARNSERGPWPWLAALAAALFYQCFHSSYYNFDGVACAIAVELGDWAHLAHGNHLAYGIVGLIWYRIWRLAGYGGPALLALQVLDGLLGGLGVGLFCGLLLRRGFRRGAALACAAGLALSQAYWFWSLEAQVYLLGAVFLILAADEALAERPSPARLGLWHAGAILGHAGHAMFLPAALWRLRKEPRATARYAASLIAVVAAAYGAAAVFCVRPRTPEDWRLWLLGSAALTPDRSFYWYGSYSWANLAQWAKTGLRLCVDPWAGSAGWALALAAFAGAVAGALNRARRDIVALCLIWIASYAALFVTWQPFLDVYRITDLVPFWLLIACASDAAPGLGTGAALAAWLAGAGLFNGRATIAARGAVSSNAEYQEARWIQAAVPEDAWVVVTARGQVYVPYFAHRRPLNMRYFDGRPEALFERLDALARAGEPVFVTADTLRQGGWSELFASYGLEQARQEEGRTLWRVKRKGNPRARARKS